MSISGTPISGDYLGGKLRVTILNVAEIAGKKCATVLI